MSRDTVPFLWNYANRFILFDRFFQLMTGPSTPGNLSIIGAQTGITQRVLHPEQAAPVMPHRFVERPTIGLHVL